jgi:plastocyanin
MNPKNLLLAAVTTAALIGMSGCGSSSDSAKAAPPSKSSARTSPESSSSTSGKSAPSAAAAMITIKSFAFQGPTSVEPGAQVMVMNSDSETHSVTSDTSGLFDANVDGGGGTATLTAPTKPGSYPYHCKYHANMHGTLVVK